MHYHEGSGSGTHCSGTVRAVERFVRARRRGGRAAAARAAHAMPVPDGFFLVRGRERESARWIDEWLTFLRVQNEDDIPFEEELLRNPFTLRGWVRYLQHKDGAPPSIRFPIFERAVKGAWRSECAVCVLMRGAAAVRIAGQLQTLEAVSRRAPFACDPAPDHGRHLRADQPGV